MHVKRPTKAWKDTCECMERDVLIKQCKETCSSMERDLLAAGRRYGALSYYCMRHYTALWKRPASRRPQITTTKAWKDTCECMERDVLVYCTHTQHLTILLLFTYPRIRLCTYSLHNCVYVSLHAILLLSPHHAHAVIVPNLLLIQYLIYYTHT